MTTQTTPKRRPIILIAIVAFATCCVLAVIIGALLPDTETTAPPPATDMSIPTGIPAPTTTVPPTKTPAQVYLDEYGGDLATYEEIFALTDCAILQDKFDTASANNSRETAGTPLFRVTLGYMTAIDEHMRAIGCY